MGPEGYEPTSSAEGLRGHGMSDLWAPQPQCQLRATSPAYILYELNTRLYSYRFILSFLSEEKKNKRLSHYIFQLHLDSQVSLLAPKHRSTRPKRQSC